MSAALIFGALGIILYILPYIIVFIIVLAIYGIYTLFKPFKLDTKKLTPTGEMLSVYKKENEELRRRLNKYEQNS